MITLQDDAPAVHYTAIAEIEKLLPGESPVNVVGSIFRVGDLESITIARDGRPDETRKVRAVTIEDNTGMIVIRM